MKITNRLLNIKSILLLPFFLLMIIVLGFVYALTHFFQSYWYYIKEVRSIIQEVGG